MTAPSRSAPRLLVVIVNFRTPEMTADCLASLADEVSALGRVKVAVVENGSGDDSAARIAAAIAQRRWEWAELIVRPDNRGYSAGNNAAIAPALAGERPDYVLLLNSDTLVRPAALSELLSFMDAHPQVGIAGSRLEDPDGTLQNSSFRFPTLISEIEHGLRLGLFTRLVADHVVAPGSASTAHPIDWVAGASMIVRTAVFEQVGLMDEGYFLYFEEVDFCLKARRAGWTCWYLPQSRVVHLVGRSTGVTVRSSPPRRPRYWWESRHRYFTRNYGRLYALATDVAWASAYATYRVRRRLQGKPDNDPPHMLADFLRFRMHPSRRTTPAQADAA